MTTQNLFGYFNRIRGAESAPLRADIDPSALKAVLPDVFMAEQVAGRRIRFRLAGTRLCSILGREARGEDFNEIWHPAHRHKMKLAVEAVFASHTPLSVDIVTQADDEERLDGEMLILPLQSRPGVTDRLFGSLSLENLSPHQEKPRILLADRFHFVTGPSESAGVRAAHEADVPVVKALQTRLMPLRLLQGGRRD